jgi:hypothetical protein
VILIPSIIIIVNVDITKNNIRILKIHPFWVTSVAFPGANLTQHHPRHVIEMVQEVQHLQRSPHIDTNPGYERVRFYP